MRYIRLSFDEEQRGSAVGIFMAGTKIGPALGFVISAYLLEAFGWRGMFAVLGLVALIGLSRSSCGSRKMTGRLNRLGVTPRRRRVRVDPRYPS